MDRRAVGTAAWIFVVFIALAGAGVAAGATTDDPVHATTTWENVTISQELALTPGQPGEIGVTATITFPDVVTEFEIAVPRGATVTDTDGFEAIDSRRYEWTGDSHETTITYDIGINETASGAGPERGSGRFLYADTGSWALVRPPYIETLGGRYRSSDDDLQVGVDRERTVAGEGAAGELTAFLGPHETYTRTAHGQTVEVIVPEPASMAAEPKAVLDALEKASGDLQVGDRDERVFAVAAPISVDWAVLGLQTGDTDFWVRADEPIAVADNTWLHEYIHTRQQLNTTAATAWLTEATATYHSAELALENDLADFEAFRDVLARGERSTYNDVVLADRDTWTGNAEYDKGSLVTGELDRLLRLATDRTDRFEDVFARLNDDKLIDHERVLTTISEVGNESVASTADRYLMTDAAPGTWTRTQHEAAFGATPAEFTTRIDAESTPYRITGPYRDVAVEDVDRLVVDETLTIPVSVTNVGGTAGTYNVTVSVDGTVVSTATGHLAAGESTVVRLAHSFEQTGSYAVRVGDNETTVDVVEPATGRLEDVAVNRTSLDEPGAVALTATVTNHESIPATASLSVTRNGTVVAERSVRLAPGETRTVETAITLSAPGRYGLGVNDRTVSVVVDPAEFTYAVDSPVTIQGPYRNLETTAIPPLVVDERLRVPVTITNQGGLAGNFTTTLSIDGDGVTQSRGRLAAGESTTVTLDHAFDQPGTYQLRVGDLETSVRVSEPATPTVRGLELDRTTLAAPGNVTATATVANDASIPATGEITVSRDSTTVATETVVLAANGTTTVSATIDLPEPGTYTIGAGDVTTSATVEDTEATSTQTDDVRMDTDGTESTTAAGPGFAAMSALVAVVGVALWVGRE